MNSEPAETSWKETLLILALIWASFLCYSFWRAPVPSVNEPHYLTKGLHFWNPDWCPTDLFLNSSNAHLVFYQIIGRLPVYFSFENSAIIGRVVGFLLMATGWLSCFRAVLGTGWRALCTAWVFLACSSLGNLSGEWIIGGIESKVLAYGFLFLALGSSLRKQFFRAALFFGLTISFHPVIGVWACCALAGTALWECYRIRRIPPLSKVALFGVILLGAASPGLVPALTLIGNGSHQANYLQVYFRLGHHLDPMKFPIESYYYYIGMIFSWVILRTALPRLDSERRFTIYTTLTILIALCGLLIGLRFGVPQQMWLSELRTGLLKFYFFRLADIFVPLAFAVSLTRLLSYWANGDLFPKLQVPPVSRKLQTGLAFLVIAGMPWFKTYEDRDPSHMVRTQKRDWLDACKWIEQNTPADARFLTPKHTWAFKWYAQRSEFFAFKDMPQDAQSLRYWYARYKFQRRWIRDVQNEHVNEENHGPLTASPELVEDLVYLTNATHYLLHMSLRLPYEPIYENDTYQVYKLPKLKEEEEISDPGEEP